MSKLKNLSTQGLEETTDVLGGYSPVETDVYNGLVKVAYLSAYDSGAMYMGLNMKLESDDGSVTDYELKTRFTLTSKEGLNYYHPKDKNGKRDTTKQVPLPDFTTANDLAQLITGEEISEQKLEEKQVQLYDAGAGKEIPQAVEVFIDLINKPVKVAVNKVEQDKYNKPGETVIINEVSKFFHPETNMTVSEYKNGKEEPVFYDKWVAKNKSKTINRVKNGNSGVTGSGKPDATATKPKTSLFAKK